MEKDTGALKEKTKKKGRNRVEPEKKVASGAERDEKGKTAHSPISKENPYGDLVDYCMKLVANCHDCEYVRMCRYIAENGTGSPYQYISNATMRNKPIKELLNRKK